MAFHLEYRTTKSQTARNSLAGDTLEQAERNAADMIEKLNDQGADIDYAEVYEADSRSVGFESGELQSTWDDETWTRVID